jgi:hypothetical protein
MKKLRSDQRVDNGPTWLDEEMLRNDIHFRISWFWDGGIGFEIFGQV